MNKTSKLAFEESYSVIEILSKSQSASTFLVQRTTTSEYFICKHYTTTNLTHAEVQSIINEITALSNLNHPNIVKLIQSFKGEREISLIEEYCEQGDLAYHIKQQQKKGRPFKQQIIQQWILQILLALDYLHVNKIIHRDLKTSNVFLTTRGNIKLGSFGLSKSLEKQKFANSCVGSPCFMSPEIISNRPYDTRTDIWALGCIIYELCMLKQPFQSPNLMQLLNKISKTEPQQIPASYSPFLSSIVKRCLRKNPEKRPTAFELLREPYFHSVMEKFVKNNGVVVKEVGIKQYNVHRGKLSDKIKKKEPKSNKSIRQDEVKNQKQKTQRKNSTNIKYRDAKLPISKLREKKQERVRLSLEKPKQKVVERSREKEKLPQLSKEKEKQKQKLKDLISSRSKEKEKEKKSSSIQKPKSAIISSRQEIRLNVQGKQNLSSLRPNIPLNPSKQLVNKPMKKQSTKTKTAESVEPSKEQIKIQQSNSWLGEQEIDYSLTKTGKFEGQFDFLKKPPALQDNTSQKDSDASIDEYCRLTLAPPSEVPSLMQTYKQKMQQLANEINQKYEPKMQIIQQRTFEFGSDEFSRGPGSFQNRESK